MDNKNTNGNHVFSGLESLGFNDAKNLSLFAKKEDTSNKNQKDTASKVNSEISNLYDKTITCPVCGHTFKTKAVKTSAPRMIKKDSDFFIRYSTINPYFYDVILCNICGYASQKSDFEKVKEYQIELIQKNISMKWKGRTYPEVFDVDIAIERYKLALLNYVVCESKTSAKAMTCLKIAWMYRLKEDSENEKLFLNQALVGFSEAYTKEDFPIYAMDNYTMMYLLGELNRRCNNNDEALRWLGSVLTSPGASPKIKDLARDAKDLL